MNVTSPRFRIRTLAIIATLAFGGPSLHAAVPGWYQTGNAAVSGAPGLVDVSLSEGADLARTEITNDIASGVPARVTGRARVTGDGGRAVVGVQMFTADWRGVGEYKVAIESASETPFTLVFTRPAEADRVRLYVRKSAAAGSSANVYGLKITTGPDPRLPFAPPTLVDPVSITLGTGFTTNRLDPNRDYVITLPRTEKIGGTQLIGGRNVVLIGGHVTIPRDAPVGDSYHRGLYIKDATGIVHVEGLLIDGSGGGDSDAIAIAAPLATVQIQNVRLEGITGTHTGWHADLVQPWGGVKDLRIHNLTGTSYYQGLQIPIDKGPMGKTSLSNVNMKSLGEQTKESGGQLLWVAHDCVDYPITLDQVYVEPRPGKAFGGSVYPGINQAKCPFVIKTNASGSVTGSWPSLRVTGFVIQGIPAAGDFVPAGVAGTGYVSPGYLSDAR